MSHILHTSTVHKTVSLTDEGNSAYWQSSGAHNIKHQKSNSEHIAHILLTYITYICGAVADRLRHRSREQSVPSLSPAWTSVLR